VIGVSNIAAEMKADCQKLPELVSYCLGSDRYWKKLSMKHVLKGERHGEIAKSSLK